MIFLFAAIQWYGADAERSNRLACWGVIGGLRMSPWKDNVVTFLHGGVVGAAASLSWLDGWMDGMGSSCCFAGQWPFQVEGICVAWVHCWVGVYLILIYRAGGRCMVGRLSDKYWWRTAYSIYCKSLSARTQGGCCV